MPEANTNTNDEVDFLELIEILWSGKGVIALFVAIGAFISVIYLAAIPPQYQSKIYYSVELKSPFQDKKKIISNFENLFFSERTLNEWKETHQQSKLNYALLSTTEMIDGFIFRKDEADRLIVFEGHFLAVNNNDFQIITDVVDYAKFSNAKLTSDLKVNIQHQISDYQSQFYSETFDRSINLENIVQLKSLEREIENGTTVLKFNAPIRPVKLSPKTSLTILISIMFGGFLGVVFVLTKNAIQTRKDA